MLIRRIVPAGGSAGAAPKAAMAVRNGEHQWCLELCDLLLSAGKDVEEAGEHKRRALIGLADRETSANGRHYYLACAHELERRTERGRALCPATVGAACLRCGGDGGGLGGRPCPSFPFPACFLHHQPPPPPHHHHRFLLFLFTGKLTGPFRFFSCSHPRIPSLRGTFSSADKWKFAVEHYPDTSVGCFPVSASIPFRISGNRFGKHVVFKDNCKACSFLF